MYWVSGRSICATNYEVCYEKHVATRLLRHYRWKGVVTESLLIFASDVGHRVIDGGAGA
jgi:hypothetical protein